jgi:hypothetical protein
MFPLLQTAGLEIVGRMQRHAVKALVAPVEKPAASVIAVPCMPERLPDLLIVIAKTSSTIYAKQKSRLCGFFVAQRNES